MENLGGIVWHASIDTQGMTTAEQQVNRSSRSIEDRFNRLDRSGQNLSRTMSRVARAVGSVLAVRQIQRFVIGTAEAIDEQGKFAQQLGVSFEELQKLQFAAEQTGASITQMNNSLRRGRRNIAEAADGSGRAADALNELGLSAEYVASLSADEQFRLIAERISDVESESRQAAIAYRIFGRDGEFLLNTLRQGRDGLAELGDEAERSGRVLDQDAADAAAKFNDELNKLRGAARGATVQVGGELLPAITDIIESFTEFLADGDRVRALVQTIGVVAQATAVVMAGRFVGSLVVATQRMAGATAGARALQASMAALGGPAGVIAAVVTGLALLIAQSDRASRRWEREANDVEHLASKYRELEQAQRDSMRIELLAERARIQQQIESAQEQLERERETQERAQQRRRMTGGDVRGVGGGRAGQDAQALEQAERQVASLEGQMERLEAQMEALDLSQQGVADSADDMNESLGRSGGQTDDAAESIEKLAREHEALRAELEGTADELEVQRALQEAGVEAGTAEAATIRALIEGNRELSQAIRERANAQRDAEDREQLQREVRMIGAGEQEQELIQAEHDLIDQLRTLQQAYYDEQLLSFEEFEQRKEAIAEQFAERRKEIMEGESQTFKDRLEEVGFSFQSMQNQAAGSIASVVTGMQSGSDAARAFARTILTQLIGAIIRMAIQAVTSQSAVTAASSAQAAALSSMYATPAALASLATSGANSVPAQAGIASTVAASNALAMGGGRLYGGNVEPGTIYPVNEDGRPELLRSGGQQYLLPGSRGEVVGNRDMQGGETSVTIDMPLTVYGDPSAQSIERLSNAIFDQETALTAAVERGLNREGRTLGGR